MTDLGLAGHKLIASGIHSALLSEIGKATNIREGNEMRRLYYTAYYYVRSIKALPRNTGKCSCYENASGLCFVNKTLVWCYRFDRSRMQLGFRFACSVWVKLVKLVWRSRFHGNRTQMGFRFGCSVWVGVRSCS